MPRCQWLCSVQANAEPDLQQTGDRLKGLVAGMVSGVLDLVAGPLEQQQKHHSCNGHQVGASLCCEEFHASTAVLRLQAGQCA